MLFAITNRGRSERRRANVEKQQAEEIKEAERARQEAIADAE